MKKCIPLLFLYWFLFVNAFIANCFSIKNEFGRPSFTAPEFVPIPEIKFPSLAIQNRFLEFHSEGPMLPLVDSIFDKVDLEVSSGLSHARIGYIHNGGILIENHSYNVARQVTLMLRFDTTATCISSSFQPNQTLSGLLVFEFDTLLAFEKRFISLEFSVPPVLSLLHHPLWIASEVSSLNYDDIPENNIDSIATKIRDSFDPNEKSVNPEGFGLPHYVPVTQEEFNFTIDFQNTGTDTAINITIADTISPYLDPLTIKPGASSHPYSWELLAPGILKFHFNNINLPDSSVNEPRSHGFISYSIKTFQGLSVGTVIKNTAHIYFDFNLPVGTNTTTNELFSCDSLTSILLPGSSFCSGDTIQVLQNSFIPHLSQWYLDSTWIVSGDTLLFSSLMGGFHQLVLVAQTAYCDQVITLPINILIPDKPVISQSGNTLTSSSAQMYQWIFNNVPIPGAHSISYLAPQTGWYQVQITDAYGCIATSDSLFITQVGIQQMVINTVTAGPNPFHDELRVTCPAGESITLALFAMDGRMLISGIYQASAQDILLDTRKLPSGIYLLRIRGRNFIESKIASKR